MPVFDSRHVICRKSGGRKAASIAGRNPRQAPWNTDLHQRDRYKTLAEFWSAPDLAKARSGACYS